MNPFTRGEEVSVVVCTYNRPNALELVLQALFAQTLKPKEVIIADDGSDNRTKAVIKKWSGCGFPITHCWQEDKGFRRAEAINKALLKVTTSYTIFIDGDCIPFPNFVNDHVRFSEPGYLLAGSRILTNEPYAKRIESGEDEFSKRSLLYWVHRLTRGEINRLTPLLTLPEGRWRKTRPIKWEMVRGCNFSVATDALVGVDGYEESITGWGLEDSDLVIRLINSGIKVKSLRFAAPVLHLWHREQSRSNVEQNRTYLLDAQQSGRQKAFQGMSGHYKI